MRRSSPKSFLEQEVERPRQVGERDALVDRQPLDLVEDRRVGGVRRVAAVGAAERDDVDRRLLRLHRADLGRRRLGAQHRLVVEEEGCERRAGRMARREVERVEVVARRLDLAAVDDLVAEPEEDVLHLAPDLRDQVQPAARVPARGQRHVDPLGGQPLVQLGPGELGLAGVDRRLEPFAHGVQRHARLAVAHLPQGLLEGALATEILDPDLLDRLGGRCGRRRGEPGPLEGVSIHGGERTSASSACNTVSLAPGRARAGTLPAWRSTTRSRRSTTRGAVRSSRTSASTSTRRSHPAGRSSSSRSARGGSRCRSQRPASA